MNIKIHVRGAEGSNYDEIEKQLNSKISEYETFGPDYQNPSGYQIMSCHDDEENLIGGFLLSRYNPLGDTIELSVAKISEDVNLFSRQSLSFLYAYLFEAHEPKIKIVYCAVSSWNKPVIDSLMRFGFSQQGHFPNKRGDGIHEHVFAFTGEQWKFKRLQFYRSYSMLKQRVEELENELIKQLGYKQAHKLYGIKRANPSRYKGD